MTGDLDDLNYEVPSEPMVIGNGGIPAALDRANWHLRNLADLGVRRHETATLFNREVERIEARRNEELAKYDRSIEWHERPLRELHAAILAEDPTRKTIVLPHGTLKSRTPQTPRLIIEDMERLVSWAKRDPGRMERLLPRPEKVRLSDLAPIATPAPTEDGGYLVLASGGEIVPGVKADLGPTTFTIDTPEEI